MAKDPALTKFQDIACCPDLDTAPICDVLDFRRHLVFPTPIRTDQGQMVQVEVIFHTRFTRCPGPMALGEIAYSTTLLPGEKVRLASSDRRSRFSFDSESKLSYRSEQISEEQYRMRALRAFMSDQNVEDSGSDKYSEQGKWDFHGDASGSLGFLSASAETNAKGSHSASSARDYLHQHRAHAEMSDNQSIEATRMAHSVSIGEVSSRTHSQGESEDHFESASREFSNPNHCHAITFLFYRINKTETIKFELVSIERRVLDPVAPLPAPSNPFRGVGQIATLPQEVPATSTRRLELQQAAINSDTQLRAVAVAPSTPEVSLSRAASFSPLMTAVAVAPIAIQLPIADDLRAKALAEVDAKLVRQRLIDKPGGEVSKEIKTEIDYERQTSIPTAGVIVKSCLDDCNICEQEVQTREQLELTQLDLQNKLLARQIELLDKSQEYRCCPPEEEGAG
ncbi:hypothetical protein LARV_00883 [Longilinea arvoryzae]|uniref:Uncharacterized protein n=1 Tax=Longilinea arvoryzae TaxID=360412 RepID=A0A0S7B741_9CHLR|nr:hypothetical protein [Longilinea arvoryzae]GAP13132.1 hypothetical protein LARV_00883 [Longilinea arvoryzae]